MKSVDLLVIGAGPNGLAIAAYARSRGCSCRILGEPMGFWKHNMPPRMLLRSGLDWHLDPNEIYTLEAFLHERALQPSSVLPIPVRLFLDYAEWFLTQNTLDVVPDFAASLTATDSGFTADLVSGDHVVARNVVMATGYKDYKHVPQELVASLPADRYAHTCDLVDFTALRDKRCLIVGGRQSAFEWAALINEECGAEVHVVYRHDMPRFAPSDWSWIDSHVAEMLSEPGWYRKLSDRDRQAVERQFWEEARLKLEPWLWDRLGRGGILSWPHRSITGYGMAPNGQIDVVLDNQSRLRVDFVLFATGYVVDVSRLALVSSKSVAARLRIVDGFPVLDDAMQSTVPGLYFTGLAATRDLGPLFGFVRGCTAAARLIVDNLVA